MSISVTPVLTFPIKYLITSVIIVLSFTVLSANTDVALAPTAHAQEFVPVPTAGDEVVTVVLPPKKEVVEEDALACNCYAYMRSLFPNLPNTSKIVPNITAHVGAIAVFDYPHYGLIVAMDAEGFWIKDSNFKKCTYQTHYMRFDNPHLIGFFNVDAMK